MKSKFIIIFIIEIFFSHISYSQSIYDGKYEMVNHSELRWWEYDEFILRKDSSFEFTRRTDYGDLIGAGKYKVTKSKLTLNFSKYDPDTSKNYHIDSISYPDTTSYSEDSIYISFTIKDVDNELLIGSTCGITDSMSKKFINQYISDEYGNINIVVSKNTIPFIIVFSYAGYNQLSILWKSISNKRVTVFLKKMIEINIISEGKVKEFRLRKINDSEFYVKRPEVEYWLHYKKKVN